MNAIALAILIALDGLVGSGVPKQIDRFGGGPAQVQAVFARSPGQNIALEASLYLDGDELLAPVGQPIPFVANPGDDPRLLSGTFALPLPDVKKPVVFRVVLAAKTEGSGPARCGDFRVVAYPKKFFSEGLPPTESLPEIAIAGKFPGLRELLDKNQIRHRDINLKTPDALPPGTIVVGEIPPAANLDGFFGESKKLLFISGALPQKPWILDARTQSFLVNAPPPEDFRESPLAQRLLLALLR